MSTNEPIFLRISGTLTIDGDLNLLPCYQTHNNRDATNHIGSALQIEFVRNDEVVLRWGAMLLQSQKSADADTPVIWHVRAKPPIPADTSAIKFVYEDRVVHEIVPSNTPPLLSSVNVDVQKARASITWNARSDDNRTLHHDVRSSGDGGQTWQRLATRLTKTALEVNANLLIGRPCIVEVVTYDGFHTERCRCEWVGKAPSLRLAIVQPEGRILVVGAVTTVRADMYSSGGPPPVDLETKWLVNDIRLTEQRGLQGVWIPESPGTYTITIRADASALSASDEVEIEVVSTADWGG